VADAQPNPGHRAVAGLESLFSRVVVITQNIDGLHQAAGSTDVIELHGSIRRYRCFSGRHTGFSLADLGGLSQLPPRCPACGDLVRPEVVWFGEMLPVGALERAMAVSGEYDAMLVVGTSAEVQPAASLPHRAAQAGAVVVDVNPNRDHIAALADVFLQGPAGVVLPALLKAVAAEMGKGDA
jgi:NAD-dependent deacetylase